MKLNRLGNSNFNVSQIGFGGASVSGEGKGYSMGAISFDESVDLIKAAFEKGINLFDTAPIYGFGESEKRIGRAVQEFRDKVFIVSKSGVGWHENGRVDMDNDPKKTAKMLDESLKRLNIDFIDLYMIHWPDQKWDIRFPLEVLENARASGKIRAIGLCNTNRDDLTSAFDVCSITCVQSEFNLFTQKSLTEIDDLVKDFDLGFMSWGTLDKGILSGTVTKNRTYDEFDARKKAPWWKKSDVDKKVDAVSLVMKSFKDHSIFDLAVNFNINYPNVTTALCGARNLKQLENLIESTTLQIDPDITDFIQRKFSEIL